jgi:hypothetical protein
MMGGAACAGSPRKKDESNAVVPNKNLDMAVLLSLSTKKPASKVPPGREEQVKGALNAHPTRLIGHSGINLA